MRAPTFFLLGIAAAGALLELGSWQGNVLGAPLQIWRNVFFVAAMGVMAFMGPRGSRVRDLPIPRNRWLVMGLIATAAVIVSLPSLTLGYLADDFVLLFDRGGHPTIWETLFNRHGEIWFRPLGWFLFRVYHDWSPLDGRLAHGVSIALFALHCVLLAPALRRLGAPRGIASAVALLFAFLPSSLETVAWATNQYSLLAGVFSAAALAVLPARPRKALDSWRVYVFAFLAFLSKEETFLLPGILVLATCHFRMRKILTATSSLWPLFVILTCALAFRAWFVSGPGGYYGGLGIVKLVQSFLNGLSENLRIHDVTSTLFPLRFHFRHEWYFQLARAVPWILVACAAFSVAPRHCVSRGLILFAVGLAPMTPLLPIGVDLGNVRWLYMPAAGLALAVVGCVVIGWLPRWLRWIPVLLLCALGAVVGRQDFQTWREASAAMQDGLDIFAPEIRAHRLETKYLVVGLPSDIDGVPVFNCGAPWAFASLRPGLQHQTAGTSSAIGVLGTATRIDLTTKTRVNFLDDPIRASLTEASVVEFAANDTERTLPVNLQYFVEDSGWAHLGYGSIDGAIFFPVTEVRPGSRLVVTTDAVLGGRSSGPASAVDVTYATKGLVIRQPWELGKTFEVPDDTTRVRVDLPVEAASTLRIQKVVLRRLE